LDHQRQDCRLRLPPEACAQEEAQAGDRLSGHRHPAKLRPLRGPVIRLGTASQCRDAETRAAGGGDA
jgi:hypothetical protein